MMEWWNDGIMGSWIMKFGVDGKVCAENITTNGSHPFKKQPSSIPLFHYSIFEAKALISINI
jgi:hypothetical protein